MPNIFGSEQHSSQRRTFLAHFAETYYTGPPLNFDARPPPHRHPTFDLCPPLTPYLLPFGFFISLLDAWCSGAILRLKGAVVVNGRQIVAQREPDGSCVFRTPEVYSSAWFGPREAAMAFMQKRIASLTCFILLILVAGWAVLLTPLPAIPYKAIVLWLANYLSLVGKGALDGNLLLSATFMLILTLIFAYGVLIVLLTSKFAASTSLGLRHDNLPSVLRMLVHTNAPRLMVSYAWASQNACTAARSLAFALPESWVDVKSLASGSHVAALTSDLAAQAEALVIFLTPEYLRSEACMVELAAAILLRKSTAQLTLVYVEEGSPHCSAAAAMLADRGCQIVSDPRELLLFLAEHLYTATTPEDTIRAANFMASGTTPKRIVPRNLRLPAPLTYSQSALPQCGGRCCAPRGSLFSGAKFISAGAEELGTAFVVHLELLLVVVVAGCFAGLAVLLAMQPHLEDAPLFFAGALITYLLLAIPVSRFIKTMAVDMDPRHWHSPLLFPLNAAAFCNTVVATAVRKSRAARVAARNFVADWQPTLKSSPLMAAEIEPESPQTPAASQQQLSPLSVLILMRDGGEPEGKGLSTCARLRNIAGYLTSVVGLECEVKLLPEDGGSAAGIYRDLLCDPTAQSVISIVLLENEADAVSFLQCADDATGELVLVASASLLYTTAMVGGGVAKLGRFMLILTGSKGGISSKSPYDGLAPAVLDSVASKVGAAIARGRAQRA